MTPKLLTGCAAFAVSLLAASCWAAAPETAISSLAAAGLGQAEAGGQVDELLVRARKLMDQGDFATAEAYVEKAEKLSSRPSSMFQIGDSPRKVRQELEQRRAATGQRPAGPTDPFLGRQTGAAVNGAGGAAPARLPATDAGMPNQADAQPSWAGGPAGQAAGASPANNRTQSDALILDARRALARGDIRRASGALEQAKTLQVRYGLLDDSPARLEATIRKVADLARNRATAGQTEAYRRQYADVLMEQAQSLARWNELDEAERLANEVRGLGINYGSFETKPESLLDQIAAQRRVMPGAANGGAGRGPYDVVTASGAIPADPAASRSFPGARTLYDPAGDMTRNVQVNNSEFAPQEPALPGDANFDAPSDGVQRVPPTDAAFAEPTPSAGMALYQQGERALTDGNIDAAMHFFRQAYAYQRELEPGVRQKLQDRLQLLSTAAANPNAGQNSLMENVAASQQIMAKQISAEVARTQTVARNLTEKEPKRAMELLEKTRTMIQGTVELEPGARDHLLKRVDMSLAEVQQYIQKNRGQLDLDEQNTAVRTDLEQSRQSTLEIQSKLAFLVEDYNKLMDEQRFAEAEVLAKKAAEWDPESPLARQLLAQSRTMRRVREQMDIQGRKENGVYDVLTGVERAAEPFDGDIQFPNLRDWDRLTKSRRALQAEGKSRRTPRDLEIEQKLSTPVSLKFHQRPLSEVMDKLAALAQVNLYLDPQGLAEEGVATDTAVTIDLNQEISLRSALKLILEPLRLSYVIKDEVLKVTSEQLRSGEVYTVSYSVADLIIPIPNFVPGGNLGMESALQQAHNRLGYSGGAGSGAQGPLAVLASNNGANANAMINPALLAQMNAAGAGTASGSPQQLGFGPGAGGLGGGAAEGFQNLIDLITSTVQPQTWDTVGGPGSIAQFETNLSLVVSQTQEVHEEIVDLLQQLRRLQDLQVTIEVRFITLNDNFFERIGVDFDFDIDNDGVSFVGNDIDTLGRLPDGPSTTVGLNQAGQATTDLQFRQGSFSASVPTFGGFDAGTAGTFGFAILSDIEAFFLIQAAQGDSRTNILQAPKVTLFNGQQAFVSDTSQRPFVTSVIPVVGDFAAAQQPVIVVLSEGTSLTVQAVVSSDRRFVRLTVVPFFSQIGEVQEFTFTGTTTTTKGSSSTTNDDEDTVAASDDETETREGTTVQLPTFSFTTVTTTVSVPDGGTVLLGGIKRLREQRNERGLPILSKLPYINRLFQNVGTGRETSSLMMMVTPRIIIQEEEEANLGVIAP